MVFGNQSRMMKINGDLSKNEDVVFFQILKIHNLILIEIAFSLLPTETSISTHLSSSILQF